MTTTDVDFGMTVFMHEVNNEMCAERRVAFAIEMAGHPVAVNGEVPSSHICTPGCDLENDCGWDACPECPSPYHEEIPVRKAGLPLFLINDECTRACYGDH